MKKFAAYLIMLAFIAIASVARADDLPAKLNFERYKGMLDHSPFAVATAVIAAPAAPNACKDLYIANAARSPDGDVVTLASTADKEFKKYLTTKDPVDGYAIASIEWSDKIGETKVTISKDGQFCTLTFNQAVLSQPMPNKPAPGVPNVPPAVQPGYPKPNNQPSFGAPTPHVRSTIQRNPQVPMPNKPPQTPPAAEE